MEKKCQTISGNEKRKIEDHNQEKLKQLEALVEALNKNKYLWNYLCSLRKPATSL